MKIAASGGDRIVTWPSGWNYLGGSSSTNSYTVTNGHQATLTAISYGSSDSNVHVAISQTP